MARVYKLILLIALAAVAILLTTTILGLHLMMVQRRRALRIHKAQKKETDFKSKNKTPLTKDGVNNKSTSKTSLPLFPLDARTNLNLRRAKDVSAARTDEYLIAADAHFGKALRGMSFEAAGDELEGSGNSPSLVYSEYGKGRGAEFVKLSSQNNDYGTRLSSSIENEKNTHENLDDKSKKGKKYGLRRKGLLHEVLKHISSILYSDNQVGNRNVNGHIDKMVHVTDSKDSLLQEKDALFHLEKAAELGNHHAQTMIANTLASGILPVTNYPELRKGKNNSTLTVTTDFSEGGNQLARANILWYSAAMEGSVEAAITLGYRHLFSATLGKMNTKGRMVMEKDLKEPKNGETGGTVKSSPLSSSHYGILGTCESSLAYYEAAANTIMDELESSVLRGKVTPAQDEHRLAEIHQKGASSALEYHNKPDELEAAIKYYRMRAGRENAEPDINDAYRLANMYHFGLRGVKQDMKEALKYYEVAADANSWEAAGQAGKFHLWGMGLEEEDRDIRKAYRYFKKGTPGGLDGCKDRLRKKKAQKKQEAESDDIWMFEETEVIFLCDHPSVNGMGLLHLFGVPNTVVTNRNIAMEYFNLAKEMGNADAAYNLGMLKLGWLDSNGEETRNHDDKQQQISSKRAKSTKDINGAMNLLLRAQQMGHIQAQHRLAMIYSRGIYSHEGAVIKQPDCREAVKMFKDFVAYGAPVSQRLRIAYKQYISRDFESSLRNYLTAAEMGSMNAQVNAAFLLEQGHCLGMNRSECLKASVRMWRAAAQQGDEEASLRVGDFYFYGRLRDDIDPNRDFDHIAQRDDDFAMTPIPLSRYVLYPEDLLSKFKKKAVKMIKAYFLKEHNKAYSSSTCEGSTRRSTEYDIENDSTCINPDFSVEDKDEITKQNHFHVAAKYYRKAAEEHRSGRAAFNLGFMHEYGIGLTQDFPLAKRYYDEAAKYRSGEGEVAVRIALLCMNIHEKLVQIGLSLQKRLPFNHSSIEELHEGIQKVKYSTPSTVLFKHAISWDSALIIVLTMLLVMIVRYKLSLSRR